MLQKDPTHRLSTLKEFVSELDNARVLSEESPTMLPSPIAMRNSPYISTILLDNQQHREEISILRELAGTGLLRWRKRRMLRRRLVELYARPETRHRPE